MEKILYIQIFTARKNILEMILYDQILPDLKNTLEMILYVQIFPTLKNMSKEDTSLHILNFEWSPSPYLKVSISEHEHHNHKAMIVPEYPLVWKADIEQRKLHKSQQTCQPNSNI